MTSSNRLYLFDTTLRDGAQTQGVDFTVADKVAIARELDLLGVDYIEGGWPGANPTDDRFFAALPVCMVGKGWDLHVDVALELDRSEYGEMIGDWIAHAKTRMDEVMFDAE